MRLPDLIRAAGAVLWRERGGVVEVALVHRPRYDDWSLPKGKLDRGEAEAVAAQREVLEETGFTGPLGRGLGRTGYDVVVDGATVAKTVRWWAMEATAGSFTANDEVDELRWVAAPEALQALEDAGESAPLERFLTAPPRTTTVLLVRHADAGDRADFDGPDDLRPLDATGREQAKTLAAVLPLWRPTRVLSAPPLRCVETVAPLGLAVDVQPAFGEAGWDLELALGALAELVSAGSPAVICSQGGAIPDLVASLCGRSDRVRSKKGSVWALSFAGPALVDADYTPSLP